MVDISKHTAPKSDQLNADDLIGGSMTVTITDVREMGAAEQPIAISFEGDNGKPYKPCKSMMRALMFVWGPDGNQYVGRRMTLWRDPSVTWAGEAIGGIRISHMSDMNGPAEFPLTATRGKRRLYRVEPLAAAKPRKSLEEHVDDYEAAIKAVEDMDGLIDIIGGDRSNRLRVAIEKNEKPELLERMTKAERNRKDNLEPKDDGPLDDLDDDLEKAIDPD